MRPFWLLCAVCGLSLMFLFYVWGKVDGVRVGYELDQLTKRKVLLEQEHDVLQLRLSQLTSPERIARLAAGRFGMRVPTPGQIVLVTPPGFSTGDGVEGDTPLRVVHVRTLYQ